MDLKNPKVTIFNYKLNKLSIYLPFALFIPFLLRNIWANREQLSYLKIISINNTENILNITPVWKLIGTTTNLFLPILAIFVFELLVLYKTNKFNLNYTSLGKLKNSEKYKYADLWYFVLQTLLSKTPFIVGFLTLGLSRLYEVISGGFHELYSSILPRESTLISSTFIFIVALLIRDLMAYLSHWLAHNIGFLWDLHEFHHSATEMNTLNLDRRSLLEDTFSQLSTVPLSVLSALLVNEYLSQGFLLPLIIFILYSAMGTFYAVLGHCSVKILYPKPFSYIFLSPSLHWLHHSTNPKHFNSNIGNVFVFWDKLFGTYLDESHLDEITGFGITNTEYNKYHPLYNFAILPVKKILHRLKFT